MVFFKLWSPHEVAGRGGGNGELLKRPGEKVLKDVTNDLVSVEAGKEHRFVIDPMFSNADEEVTREREEINQNL
jgi:hypothetical protein